VRPITFGSLFAGIGGFDLGFERAGIVCKWQVEIDDYATKVLEKHWLNVHRERDIRQCGKHNLEYVDVICGGFPCQDISYAGLGAGLDGERSGLFFEAIRLVSELQPRVVVLENVAALLTRGLDRVLGTLAEIGFDAEWHCIPAAAFGAPHIRDRVWIVAYSGHSRILQRRLNEGTGEESDQLRRIRGDVLSGREQGSEILADSDVERQSRKLRQDESWEASSTGRCGEDATNTNSEGLEKRPAQTTTRTRTISRAKPCRSEWWATEPDIRRVAHGIPKRVDRLRGLGNAVVPQVAEWIGRQIVEQWQSQQERSE
jgi:DNA (cytosine-5)-methyltransferase 1